MPATSGSDPDPQGRMLREEPGIAPAVHREHEARDRQRARSQALCKTNRDRRTGVSEPAAQQAAGPLHAAITAEGERAVAAVLPGSQPRKAGASWVGEIGRPRAPVAAMSTRTSASRR